MASRAAILASLLPAEADHKQFVKALKKRAHMIKNREKTGQSEAK